MLWKLSLAALLGAAAFAAPQEPPKYFPYNYRQEDLPNGLRLITVPTDFPHIVSVYIVVQTGSRNEVEPGHTGFAHLFEHLMFKGTEKYPAAKAEAILKQIGAASNAFTTADYTCYQTTFSREDLGSVLEMQADRFQNLKYNEAEFKTEALAVLGEYNKNSANPGQKLSEVVRDTAFDGHTYKHTTMGFLKDIQDMPNQYEYSRQFFNRYYRPEYATILVVGDVKPKAVREVVDKYWSNWKRGSYTPEIPVEPAQEGPRNKHVEWPGYALPLVSIAYKGPAYTDSAKESAALEALALLAFSPESELYQKLVIREQKADQLNADNADNARMVDPFLFDIRARVKRPEDLPYVQSAILETVAGLRQKPFTAAQVDAVRKHLRYAFAQRLRSNEDIAGVLASFVALRRTPETISAYYGQVESLTPEDLQDAAAKYLIPERSTMVTLTGAESGQ